MNHASLFSGIGGFDIASEWIGWTNVFCCDNNRFCQKILKKHFPNSILYEDIKETDFTKYRRTIDVISGGFPCQPFSTAGKRKGKDDDRYLWYEMLRAIKEIEPKFIVCENVPGIISMELDKVLFDLENEGYKTETFIIPACSKNAPHKRERVWIIAYANSQRLYDRNENNSGKISSIKERIQNNRKIDRLECFKYATNTIEIGCTQNNKDKQTKQSKQNISNWRKFPSQSPVCRRDDGIPNRVDRLKSLGNAIVPQIAYEIFNIINQIQKAI